MKICFYINNEGVFEMETKTLDYCGRDFTLLRVADHLWVSKESVNDQRLVNEFSLEKLCWYSSWYTDDEVEYLKNNF